VSISAYALFMTPSLPPGDGSPRPSGYGTTLLSVIELGSRARSQPPPPHVVFDSLCQPDADPARPWLRLLADEVRPRVLHQVRPELVVWSSLWLARPALTVRFDLAPDGPGCLLRWTLLSGPTLPMPDASALGHLRKRLNVVVNRDLRFSYGQ
jgi:hypothetical protein